MKSAYRRAFLAAAFFSAVISLSFQPAFGQIEVFDDPERFGEEAITLEPRFFNRTPMKEAFSVLGVSFGAEPGSRVIRDRVDIDVPLFIAELVFRNERIDGGFPTGAMIVDFHRPVSRLGFQLGNGAEGAVARIEAFNPRGLLLGSFEVTDIDEQVGPFVGIECQDPSGIAKIVVDYGDSESGEQLSGVTFEYQDQRSFRRCLAHVGQGVVGGARLRTTIRVTNLARQATSALLELFDDDGAPLSMNFNGEMSSSFEVDLRFVESLHLRSQAEDDELRVGYGCVTSPLPIVMDAIFQTEILATGETFEAGIDARASVVVYKVAADVSADDDLNTAVAVLNESDSEVLVGVSFWADGAQIQSQQFTLEPGKREAFFITELLPRTVGQSLTGTLSIVARADVYATTLRSRRGVAVSSLSLGTEQVFENPK